MPGAWRDAHAAWHAPVAQVENQERAWKSGPAYTSHWQPLVKALITLYPCFTLLVLVSLSVEYTMRKFMWVGPRARLNW